MDLNQTQLKLVTFIGFSGPYDKKTVEYESQSAIIIKTQETFTIDSENQSLF